MLATLARLIAYETIAGRPNEALIADVAERLAANGAIVNVISGTRPDARNLHAVLGPPDVPGGVLLSAHTDVVDTEGQPWTRDPFRLVVDDGKAYGRGTTDMKGFIAVVLDALSGIDGRALSCPIHIALSSDEELGCKGVGPLLDVLAALPVKPDWALVGEPTELRVVDRHKGKAAVRIHITGRAAHSSTPSDGVNAVAYAARLIGELFNIQDELAADARSPGFMVPYSTVGIGPIHGGVSVNIVPDRCRLDVEIRSLPEQDPLELMSRIERAGAMLTERMAAQHRGTGIRLEQLSSYPGLRPRASAEVAGAITALTGQRERNAVDFGTEAGLYQQRLGIPVVVCGPGSMSVAHQADEYISLDQLDQARGLITRLLQAMTRPQAVAGYP